MKAFILNFKDRDYETKPLSVIDEEQKQRYNFLYNFNKMIKTFKGKWKPNTNYNKFDIVFDDTDSKQFYVLRKDGTSSNVESIENDELPWIPYYFVTTYQIKDFLQLLTKLSEESIEKINKYRNNEKYYDVYNISTNTKIEQISYSYYDSVDYWDVILLMNDLKSILDIPKNEDVLIDKTYRKLYKWGQLFGYTDTDFEILDNYINFNKWGIEKKIVTTFEDENTSGIYYLNEGDVFKIHDYQNETDVLFIMTDQVPQKTKIEFNDADFPLQNGDICSFRVCDVDITYVANGGEDKSTLIQKLMNKLISSNPRGILTPTTDNSSYIIFDADRNVSSRFVLRKNVPTNPQTPNDNIDIFITQLNKDITVHNSMVFNVFKRIYNTFIEIDMKDPDINKKYTTFYKMFKKYYDEFQDQNESFSYVKLLKKKYLNEFKRIFDE